MKLRNVKLNQSQFQKLSDYAKMVGINKRELLEKIITNLTFSNGTLRMLPIKLKLEGEK